MCVVNYNRCFLLLEVQLRESLLDSHTHDLSIEVQKRPPRDSKRTKRPDSAW